MIAQIVCKWVLYLIWWALAGTIVYGVVSSLEDVKDFLNEVFGI